MNSRSLLSGVLGATAVIALTTWRPASFGPVASASPQQDWGTGDQKDRFCVKERRCDGASPTGTCDPAGFLCGDVDCADTGTCSWYYNWFCLDSCGDVCYTGSQNEISYDCAPYCKSIAYNQCACSCQSDPDDVEGGPYFQCW